IWPWAAVILYSLAHPRIIVTTAPSGYQKQLQTPTNVGYTTNPTDGSQSRGMTGFVTSSSLPNAPAKVLLLCDLPTFVMVDCGARALPWRRLRAGWMEVRVTKVARVSARFSKSLAGVGCDSQVRGRWMNCCPGASSPHHPGSFMAFLGGQNRGQ